MISPACKTLIQRVINVFETGTPDGRYDALVVYADGRNGSRQITFGRSQTTEQGNLKQLVAMYVANQGSYAARFEPWLPKIGVKPLANDDAFKTLLRTAARQDPVMRSTQDLFFDKAYWNRAAAWFDTNGFALPLSMLVVYDSYIHSGGVPGFLRKRFMATVPAAGGEERRWTASYVESRHQWLKHHTNPLLQKTTYRTQTFLDEIARGNWMLDRLPVSANGVKVG
jgi:chitosanase